VLDETSQQPVIGLAGGETRWRGMTTENMLPLSRDASAPEWLMAFSLRKQRAQETPGAKPHPQPRVQS